MDPRPLSTRTCFFLILLFGIAAYSNTFNVPFQFDDTRILENHSLRPPLNPVKIWQGYPSRVVANLSFALQFALTGAAPWGFHVVNLLIHLLASMAVFGTTRLLLRTPALRETIPFSQHDLFALAPALLFLTHPVQTQAVTYIIQRMTSLAALFYLATLWMYLKARLKDTRHYRLVFLFMLAAMLTKEISFTLPFAILLIDVCFFPVSANETIRMKLRRWIPFAAFLLIIPLIHIICAEHLVRSDGAMDANISHWNYLLTQFRVLRTYLRLLVFPVGQCLDYDYRLSSGWGDLDTWTAFSLLLSIFILALAFFKKNRLLSFGVLWFFLTLSAESSLIPIKDVIFEHRLYLPMFGFSVFLASLLWQCARSASRFLAIILGITVVLSGMTYARNEVWKSPFTLWQDVIKKSPFKPRGYHNLAEIFGNNRQYRQAADNYLKTLQLAPPEKRYDAVYNNLGSAFWNLGETSQAEYWFKKGLENHPRSGMLYTNLAVLEENRGHLAEAAALCKMAIDFDPQTAIAYYVLARIDVLQGKYPQAIALLEKAIQINPAIPFLHVQLGELYRESGQEDAAIRSFQKAITAAPSSREGYDALVLLYKEKGENQKALAVMIEYLQFKKKKGSFFGD